jgi:hypothetical protein
LPSPLRVSSLSLRHSTLVCRRIFGPRADP